MTGTYCKRSLCKGISNWFFAVSYLQNTSTYTRMKIIRSDPCKSNYPKKKSVESFVWAWIWATFQGSSQTMTPFLMTQVGIPFQVSTSHYSLALYFNIQKLPVKYIFCVLFPLLYSQRREKIWNVKYQFLWWSMLTKGTMNVAWSLKDKYSILGLPLVIGVTLALKLIASVSKFPHL